MWDERRRLDMLLYHMVKADDVNSVEKLLQQGANPNTTIAPAMPPLLFHISTSYAPGAQSAMLETLLNHGADPFLRSQEGNTLLHHMSARGRDGMIAQLLEAGLDPLATNKQGYTPLAASSENAWPSVYTRLALAQRLPRIAIDDQLTHDALFTKNHEGYTPMDNPIIWRQFGDIAARLEQNGEPPVTRQDLMQHDKVGTPFLVRAIRAFQGDTVLDYLEARQDGLEPEQLKAVNDKDNALTDALIRRNQFSRFFTTDYWRHRSPHQLIDTFNGLDSAAQGQVTNYRRLLLEKNQTDLATSQGR